MIGEPAPRNKRPGLEPGQPGTAHSHDEIAVSCNDRAALPAAEGPAVALTVPAAARCNDGVDAAQGELNRHARSL